MRIRTGLSLMLVLAGGLVACGRQNGTVDAGTTTTDAGAPMTGDAGSGAANYVKITVTQAWGELAAYSGSAVEIDGAIVVAANTYDSKSTKCATNMTKVETFYIQDPTGGAGIAVYHGCNDQGDFPNVGDIVTVEGRLSKFDGSLQISSSTKLMIALDVKVTSAGGGNGKAMAGAYPPAGTPKVVAASDRPGFAHTIANPHPELLGTALEFDNITITNMNPAGLTYTSQDGGVRSEGFEISDGVWVDDSSVYSTCIKGTIPDGGTYPLTGVTGMWDRYQDYYGRAGDGGYAPVVPVLVPQSCADLVTSSSMDAGTGSDAGTATDAGSADAG